MLKKKLMAIALMLGLFTGSIPAMADVYDGLGETRLGIDINGKSLYDYTDMNDVRPVMKNNRVLAPLRIISEYFDSQVAWNNKTKVVTIVDNETGSKYVFNIGQKYFTKNGTKVAIDQGAIVTKAGVTVVPIRVIAEMYGKVKWDAKNKNVLITTDRKSPKERAKDNFNQGLNKATYLGVAKEVLGKYVANRANASYLYFDDTKVYYLDNSDFLKLKMNKVRENEYYLYSEADELSRKMGLTWYITPQGEAKDISDGWTFGDSFKSQEEANEQVQYLIIGSTQNGTPNYYILKVNKPIPLKKW